MVTADWEAVLAAEGLAPVVLTNGCSARMLELCTEPFTGASGSDEEERQRLRGLEVWLPDFDRRLLTLLLQGHTHQEVGAELGIRRNTVWGRIQRAQERLRRLDAGPLPSGRRHFLRLARGSWTTRASRWSDGEAFFAALLSTWSPTAAAMHVGRARSTGYDWAAWATGSEVDERVRHVVSVVRSMRMEAR